MVGPPEDKPALTAVVGAHVLLLLTAMWAVWSRHGRSVRWATAVVVWSLVTVSQWALRGAIDMDPFADFDAAAMVSQNGLLFVVLLRQLSLRARSMYELQRTVPGKGELAMARRAALATSSACICLCCSSSTRTSPTTVFRCF